MSIPWCPVVEHVTPAEPWSCETCHEHGCDLCDDSTRFDEDGGHRCEACAFGADLSHLASLDEREASGRFLDHGKGRA